jgi:hypothetical protein
LRRFPPTPAAQPRLRVKAQPEQHAHREHLHRSVDAFHDRSQDASEKSAVVRVSSRSRSLNLPLRIAVNTRQMPISTTTLMMPIRYRKPADANVPATPKACLVGNRHRAERRPRGFRRSPTPPPPAPSSSDSSRTRTPPIWACRRRPSTCGWCYRSRQCDQHRRHGAHAVADVAAAVADGALPAGQDAGLPLHRFPLAKTGDAHAAVQNNAVGKVIIEVTAP